MLNLAVFPVRYNDKFYQDIATVNATPYTHLGAHVMPLQGSLSLDPSDDGCRTCLNHLSGYFSDIMVGAICSRVEPHEGSTFKVTIPPCRSTSIATFHYIVMCSRLQVYIMTIGVLACYRRLGIGSRLLQEVLNACNENPDCAEVYLHVQVRRFPIALSNLSVDRLVPRDSFASGGQ